MSKLYKKYSNEPWTLWLLICLSRQIKRQSWLKSVHDKIMEKDLGESGIVPNHPEWEYYYHGMGLCLTGPNNEVIDVDFHDEDGLTIDPYFFTTRIFELSEPDIPEARLRHWLPEAELIVLLIRNLQGSLFSPRRSHVFRLNKKYQADWEYLNEIDPLSIEEGNASDREELKKNHKGFQKWLLKELKRRNLRPLSFEAIVKNLSDEKQAHVCLKNLKKIDHKMAAALKILSTNNAAPMKEIVGILKKLNPNKHHPYLAHTVCNFLLNRDSERELCFETLRAFSDKRVVKGYSGNPYDYDLAHLMLKHSPNEGLTLLRRALRSSTPDSVESSAALMAAIDEDWSNQELMQVLNDRSFDENPTNRRYIVSALMNSKNKSVREFGQERMPSSRVREENEIGFTFDEVVEHNLDDSFTMHLEKVKKDLSELNLEEIRAVII